MLFKNKFFASFSSLICFVTLFISCIIPSTTNKNSESGDYSFIENLGSKTQITLNNVKGKQLFYVCFNNSDSETIEYKNTRYLFNAEGVVENRKIGALYSQSQNQNVHANIKHFVSPENFSAKINTNSRAATKSESKNYTEEASLWEIGKKKEFYCDNNIQLSSYEKKEVILAAKGQKNGKTICLVWVDSSLYNLESDVFGEKINQSIAENIATKFAEHYAHEKAIFGDECEYLFDKNGYSYNETMDYNSPTGNLINIVIYDIGNDYESSGTDTSNLNENESGIVGYFYSKDYFEQNNIAKDGRAFSNEGKFFYIDAAWCNYSGINEKCLYDGVKIDGKNVVSDVVISTLFHEFQHMINFAQKNINNELVVETWYNEMLSMLAEDMMTEQLKLSENDKVWNERLPVFNQFYWSTGIDEWVDEREIYSYAMAYTFGAWLSREYGGPKFVKSMSSNNKTGIESIRKAIKDVTGKEISSSQLYKNFIQAVVFHDDFAKSNNLYSLNKEPGNEISAFGYTSSMNSISLFDDDEKFFYPISTKKSPQIFVKGPLILSKENGYSLRPHGFVIYNIGKASSDSVVLNFSKQKSSNEEVMIFIQDDFSNLVGY